MAFEFGDEIINVYSPAKTYVFCSYIKDAEHYDCILFTSYDAFKLVYLGLINDKRPYESNNSCEFWYKKGRHVLIEVTR